MQIGSILGYKGTADISKSKYKKGTSTYGVGNDSSGSGTQAIEESEMPSIISVVGGLKEDYENNINKGLPILSWQTNNDKLDLINSGDADEDGEEDNAFVLVNGVNNNYPLLKWQVEETE